MSVVYEGTQPYIFISYSHKDNEQVHRIIRDLQARGFRIWYDNGIEAGSEWPEYIAAHLRGANCVISFISSNFVSSQNCRRELIFSQDLDKPMLCVYLEETELSDGIRMQLGLNQALFRDKYDSLEAFSEALANAVLLQPCRETDSSSAQIQDLSSVIAAKDSTEPDVPPASEEEKDPPSEAARLGHSKLSRICVLAELLALPLTLLAVNYVTAYVTHWFAAALLIAVPHVLIDAILVNRIHAFRKKCPEMQKASFTGYTIVWFLVTLLSLILSYFYIHYSVNFLLKLLIALGLNLLPAIITLILVALAI